MFLFVLKVVIVSILVSLFSTWIRLIPHYQRRRHFFIQQLINTGLLSIILTLLTFFGIYPSWLLLFGMVLFVLWWSVQITNDIVKKREDSAAEKPN